MVVTERPGKDAVSVLHEVLAAPQRRHAIDALASAGGPESLTWLATEVAARETGRPTSEVRFDRIRDVRVDLHHNHLPRLAEWEFVEYDSVERVAELSDSERTRWLLQRLEEVGDE